MRAASCVLLVLSLVLVAGTALAQRIAIARVPGDQKITRRVTAELSALGFEVELVSEAQSTEPSTLSEIALGHAAVAALRASPSKTGIELWIADPETGTTAFEEVVTVASGRNDELLALRAVEVLRARLLKLGVVSGPAPREPASLAPAKPPVPAPKVVEPPKSTLLWAEIGVGYAYEVSDLSNHALASLGFTLSPSRLWSLSIFGLIPVQEAELTRREGSVDVAPTLVGLAGDLHWRKGWFIGSFGAGAALAILSISGHASPPYQGTEEQLFTGVPLVRAAGTVLVADRLSLKAELLAGVAIPPITVRVNEDDAASWGRPLVMGTLSLSLGLLDDGV